MKNQYAIKVASMEIKIIERWYALTHSMRCGLRCNDGTHISQKIWGTDIARNVAFNVEKYIEKFSY